MCCWVPLKRTKKSDVMLCNAAWGRGHFSSPLNSDFSEQLWGQTSIETHVRDGYQNVMETSALQCWKNGNHGKEMDWGFMATNKGWVGVGLLASSGLGWAVGLPAGCSVMEHSRTFQSRRIHILLIINPELFWAETWNICCFVKNEEHMVLCK